MTGCLLTTRQVADILGMSKVSVLRLWRDGELLGYRIKPNVLRFAEEDVDAFLSGKRPGSRLAAVTDGRTEQHAG